MKVKKRILYVVLFCLISTLAAAQDTGIGAFENKSVILPPGPPEEPSKFSSFFELKDYSSKELIKDIHVYIAITNLDDNIGTSTLKYIDERGVLELMLGPGDYRLAFKVDDLKTSGKDYFFESDFEVSKDTNHTLFLFPVGSLRGFVYDGDRAVNGAELKFKCSAGYGEFNGVETDSFGSFSNEWLPVGLCRVSAEYNKKMGFKDVEIKKGELGDADIQLSKSIISKSYGGFLLLALIVAIILFYFYKTKRKEKKSEKENLKENVTQVELSSRTKDVLNTLKEKEKEVVNFLLENDYHSTQARIRNNTGIPKTSLARLFVSLEAKNIINVEKIGKLKKIKLTDWFLGK